MKRFFLPLAAILLAAALVHAQQDAFSGFMEQHKSEKGFIYAFLSKDLFEVVTQTGQEEKDWKKLHNVVKNIGNLRILAGDSIENGQSLYKEALALVPGDVFDELLSVRDGEDKVRIWAKEENNAVTDLVLLVGASDAFVLVCFAGKLELGNVSELAHLFEAGAAEQLARATEAVAIDFTINPNPNNGEFTLGYSDEQDPPALFSIIDQNGRQLFNLNTSGSSSQQIAIPDLPSGLYWVQLKTRAGKVGVKQLQIVKSR